jgi:hypothetical protein
MPEITWIKGGAVNKKDNFTDQEWMDYLNKPFKVIKYDMFLFEEARNGNQLLQIRFEDSSGKVYIWTPKWKDLAHIFEESIAVERMNGGKHWIEIAAAAMQVLSYLINLLYLSNKGKLPNRIIGPDEPPEDMLDVRIRKMVI